MSRSIRREATRAFVLMPIVLLAGAAVLALVSSLAFTAYQSNSLALAKQREFLGNALSHQGHSFARELKVQTTWSEAYQNASAGNAEWLHTYFGTFLDRLFNYSRTYVLSGADVPVYAYEDGHSVEPQRYTLLGGGIADLLRAVRETDAGLHSPALSSMTVDLGGAATVEHRSINDVRLIDGKPAFVIVSTIVPDAPLDKPMSGAPPLLVSVSWIDAAMLHRLGSQFGFADLVWTAETRDEAGRSHFEPMTLAGTPLGTFSWVQIAPGLSLVKDMAPGLFVAVLLLAGLAVHLGRRGTRQALLIDQHARDLRGLNEGLEERVLSRTHELEATLGNISQGILMLGPDRKVLVANARARTLLGLEPDADLTATIELLLKNGALETKPQAGEARANPRRFDFAHENGRVLEVARSELASGGAVLTLTDITLLKRRQSELQTAMEAATTANRTKTQFLSTMSHEMRTPLNGVIGALDLLGRTSLDGEQRRLLDTALCSGEALLVHINDVLDFSKMEAGKLDLVPAPFAVRRIVDEVLRIVEPQAAARETKLSSHIGADVPTTLVADAVRVRQILLNLAGNAAKFTHSGSVAIDVRRIGGSDEKPDLEFSVTDTGPGIPAHRISSMFQEFSMLDATFARREGGTGLGLAICKRLVSAMDGSIGVESEVGKGSRFWFRVGFERGADVAPAATRAEAMQAEPSTPLEILLVDDSSVNRMIGSQMLSAAGHTVETATNGVEAVAKAGAKRYDVILMDISMPEMDGLEASRRIRQLGEPLCGVPIVALTANAVAGDREQFMAAGMNDYLTKPYRRADIERMLAALLQPSRKAA